MEVTEEYVEKLLEKTETAMNSVEVLEEGNELFDMTKRYVSDAKFFFENGELVNALGAVEYAHGLLDAGVALKVLRVMKNKELFVF